MQKELIDKLIASLSGTPKSIQSNNRGLFEAISNYQIPVLMEAIKILHFYLGEIDPKEKSGEKISSKINTKTPQLKMNALLVVKCIVAHCCSSVVIEILEAYLLPIILENALFDKQEIQQERGVNYFVRQLENKKQANEQEITAMENYGYNYVRLCTQLIIVCSAIKPKRLEFNKQIEDPSEFFLAHQLLNSNVSSLPKECMYFKSSEQLKKKFRKDLKDTTDQRLQEYSQFVQAIFDTQFKSGFQLALQIDKNNGVYPDLDIRKLLILGNYNILVGTLQTCNQALKQSKSIPIILYALEYINQLLLAGNHHIISFFHKNKSVKKMVEAVVEMNQKQNLSKGEFMPNKKGTNEEKSELYLTFLSSLRFWALGAAKFSCLNSEEFSKIFKYYFVLNQKYKIQFPHDKELDKKLSESNRNYKNKIALSKLIGELRNDLEAETADPISEQFNIQQYFQGEKKQQNAEKHEIQNIRLSKNESDTSFQHQIAMEEDAQDKLGGELLNISSIPRISRNNLSGKYNDGASPLADKSNYPDNDQPLKNIKCNNQERDYLQIPVSRKQVNPLPHETQQLQLRTNLCINLDTFAEQVQNSQIDLAATKKYKRSLKASVFQAEQNSKILNQQQYGNVAGQNPYSIKLLENAKKIKGTDSLKILNSAQNANQSIYSSTKKVRVSNFSNSNNLFPNPSIIDSEIFPDDQNKPQNLGDSVLETQRINAPFLNPLDDSCYPSSKFVNESNNKDKSGIKKCSTPQTFHEVINSHKNTQNIAKYKKLFELQGQCRSLLKPCQSSQSSSSLHQTNRSLMFKSESSSLFRSASSRKSEHKSQFRKTFSKDKEKERLLKILQHNQKKNQEDMKNFEYRRQQSLKQVHHRISSLQKQKIDMSEVIKKKNNQISQLKDQNSLHRLSVSEFNNDSQNFVLKKLAAQNHSSNIRPLSLRNRKQTNSTHMKINISNQKIINYMTYKKYFMNCNSDKLRKSQLKNKQLVYKNDKIQIGCVGHREGQGIYKICLYVTPEQNVFVESLEIKENDSKLKINKLFIEPSVSSPIQINKRHQCKFNFSIQVMQTPFTLPQICINYGTSINQKSQKKKANFLLPCPFHKFFSFQDTYDWTKFKNDSTIRSQEFPYSKKILKNIDVLKDYIPNLQKLNNGQLNMFGELTFGTYAAFKNTCFPFRVSVKQNQFIYFEAAALQSQEDLKHIEFLMATMSFLLMKQFN